MKIFACYFCLAFFIAFITLPAQQESSEAVTINWIFGDEPNLIENTPYFFWLNDGTAFLYDETKPIDERAYEIIDPSTGDRTKLLDIKTIENNLSLFLGDNVEHNVGFPNAINVDGTYAILRLENDLYLLNLSNAHIKRITENDLKEIAITFAPDGKKVGFVRDNDLYIYDIEKDKEIRLTDDGSDTIINGTFSWVYWEEIYGHRDAAYWWSDNSQTIAFLRSDDSKVSIAYYTDFEPYQPNVIKQRYPKVGEPTPEVKVGIISVNDTDKVWMNLTTDSYEYIVRVDWIPGSKILSVQTMNRSQDEINLWRVAAADGSVKLILKETDGAWLHVYKPYFYKNGNHLLWISERDGYTHIYRYETSGELLNQVTKGEWSLRPFGAFAMYGASALASVDEKNDWIYFTSGEKSPLELHLYKIKSDGTDMKRITNQVGSHNVTFSKDTEYYFDSFSNISKPPALALHKNSGELIENISLPREVLINKYNFQFPEFISLTTEDGFEIPGQISKPQNFNPNIKYPVVIYVYGGPSAQTVVNTWNNNGWAHSIYFDQVLLHNNFIVFTFDNRAAAAKSKLLESTIKKEMYGDIELNDLLAVTKWLKKQSYVDSNRIGIWGWSGGGTYTLLALTHSKEFKAGISVAPVTDWRYYDVKWAECVMKRPVDNPDGYERTSLVKHAKDLSGKLMLVHGTYDDNVHIQNSRAFSNELIKENIMFDMMIYPMRKHGISDAPARIHLFNKMLNFWKVNL